MENSKVNMVSVVKFAGAYVACIIGSGFATGQEIMQFFTSSGLMGIGASIIAMVIFSWFGGCIMEHGRELQLKNPGMILRYYCGAKLGVVVEWMIQLVLFCVFVVMISGAGATLSEYYGMNPMVGRVLMALLALGTVLLGLSKLMDILGVLGPIIIIFSVGIGLISIFNNLDGLKNAEAALQNLEVAKATKSWWISGILYPAYNVFGTTIFLAGMGASAGNKKEALLGGTLGGILLGAAILAMNTGLLASITNVADKQVPSLVLATNISPALGVIFSIILVFGIYTTATPFLWSVCSKLAVEEKTKKFAITAVVITIVAFFLGLLPFGVLVGIIYPFTGYLGLMMFLFIFYRTFVNKGNMEQLGRELNK